jgi:uncharacterized protein
MAVFINEIHYDNTGADAGEAIEIAGTAGTDLTGWSLVLYNGTGGVSYATIALSGVIGDQGNGFGALQFLFAGIQNGSPDGIALVNNNGLVVQFLSYEGVMTATNGPAAGLTSVDIGVSELGTEAVGGSLHLVGTGSQYSDFTWARTTGATFGATNTGQSFAAANPGVLSIADASVTEGNNGDTPISFTVTRAGGAAGAVSATYTITFDAGGADGADLGATTLLTGTVNFADGETSQTITINVAGEIIVEPTETFTVTLSAPTGGASIADGVAIGTITNDDAAATIAIADATVLEGNAGTTAISFVVTRSGDTANAVSADYAVTFDVGGASADDLSEISVFTGTVSFAAGETSSTIELYVDADTVFEGNETFNVTLSNASAGALITDGTAIGTITNDDTALIANVFINEIHYDDVSTDTGEGVEVAGEAGTNLAGWSLVFYNGNGGASYGTVALSGIIGNQSNGYGTLQFPFAGIQNGAPDGIALVDNTGRVVQFLSYEGVMTATNGPASGLTSTDIGVSEDAVPDGFSLQLVGSGGSYEDFAWTTAAIANTAGTPNTGQSFLSASDPGQIRVLDASVAEGNSGEALLTFTVRRAGGTALTSDVTYTVNLDGTANATDLGASAVLSGTVQFAIGETVRTITVAVQGDVMGEFNETLSVTLTSATNAAIVDAGAIGTIVNDDPLSLAIYQIQGESHLSVFAAQNVTTTGVVTAVDTNGFYLQDATGDGNVRTSDAIFVFTNTPPTVAVGDSASVTGIVAESRPGNNLANLTTTQIDAPVVTVLSSGNALPAATLIGTGGVLPPSDVFDDDQFLVYDPQNDAADFYESLEGMRVTIDAPLVTSATNSFGETYVVASGGTGATGVNSRGGITIAGNENNFDDYNPERLQLDDDSGLFAGYTPNYTQGDRLSNVTGIVNYNFQSYEVLVTEAVTIATDVGALPRETTLLQGTDNRLSIAAYNVENLDPGDNKFDILAGDIVFNLRAPDIISLEEIQDADGAGSGSDLSGYVTAQGLIDAIRAIGGPNYVYIEVAPGTANSTGGEPGGNIRNGFLYNMDRVEYVAGSAVAVPGAAFNGSRSPLAAQFNFNGETITAISVHSTSRGGSDPLFGASQPPVNAGEAARVAQSTAISAYVTNLLSTDPDAYVAVLGDFNAFYFENALELVENGVLTNLHRTLPEEERYSYVFEGNAQAIDHILVSNNLLATAQFDAVHINSEQPDTAARATDHDPLVATLLFNSAPVAQNASASGDEDSDINGTLNVTDRNGDVLTYSLVNGPANGAVTINASGNYIYTPNANFNGADSFTYRANDGVTNSTTATISLTVNAVNDPLANLVLVSGGSVVENAAMEAAVAQLTTTDPDGSVVSYALLNDAAGRFTINAANGQISVANGVLIDFEQSPVLSVTVRATSSDGSFADRTLAITVNDINPENIVGTSADETVFGGASADTFMMSGGRDYVSGRGGGDILDGGAGSDRLIGGAGMDIAVYGVSSNDAGVSIIRSVSGALLVNDGSGATDILRGVEQLQFTNGTITPTAYARSDINGDGSSDILTYSQSTGLILRTNILNGVQTSAGVLASTAQNPSDTNSGDWDVRATGDFNYDGLSDVVLKNQVTGQFYVWSFTDQALTGGFSLGFIGTNWDVLNTADFNRDGNSDILWRNADDGHHYVWTFDQTGQQTGGASLGVLGTNWTGAGVGDFDGDGDSDVLLRNSDNGQLYLYFMENGQLSGSQAVNTFGTDWVVGGIGDFNGDAISDVVLKNIVTGQFYGLGFDTNSAYTGNNLGIIGTDLNVSAVGDYNNDGIDDLLLRSTTTNLVAIQIMEDGRQAGGLNNVGALVSDLVIV